METHRIEIAGMSCGHCVAAVRKELEEAPGVTPVTVEIGYATVEIDDATQGLLAAREAVAEAGFTVVGDQP
ncbi:heavy-metal-associated domain-containing protein [soil metagenome]